MPIYNDFVSLNNYNWFSYTQSVLQEAVYSATFLWDFISWS